MGLRSGLYGGRKRNCASATVNASANEAYEVRLHEEVTPQAAKRNPLDRPGTLAHDLP